jgi:hypothetical protein
MRLYLVLPGLQWVDVTAMPGNLKTYRIMRYLTENPRNRPHAVMGAAGIVVGESVVFLFSDHPVGLDLLQLSLGLVLGLLLLRGNRIGWVTVLIGSFAMLVGADGASLGFILATAVLVVCLVAPPSFRFFWRSPASVEGGPASENTDRWKGGRTFFYPWVARVALWEHDLRDDLEEGRSRSYATLLWRLGVAIVFLLLLLGVLHTWLEDVGGESLILAILLDVVWTTYMLIQLAFLAAAVLAVRGHLLRRRKNLASRS